jgi:hypothetical protein
MRFLLSMVWTRTVTDGSPAAAGNSGVRPQPERSKLESAIVPAQEAKRIFIRPIFHTGRHVNRDPVMSANPLTQFQL